MVRSHNVGLLSADGPREGITRSARRSGSLGARWHRAFAVLAAAVLLTGLATILGTRLLVATFRDSAVSVEHEATIDTRLRADLVTHAIAISGEFEGDGREQLRLDEAAVRSGFAAAIANQDATVPQRLYERASARWEAMAVAADPAVQPDSIKRGQAVARLAPAVLTLLDAAGSAGRAAARADVVDATLLERKALAGLAVMELAALALTLRLARRLGTEVLRPVRILRDSANHLAAGRLDHRIVVDRADELGELAVSFNAMAESIAGSQRSLSLQANTDSLSGLANRAAFLTRLEATFARPDRRRDSQAVLFIDLDDFKDVNDTQGHAAGDELLRVVAARLIATARPGDLVARLGGDEFAVLLDGLDDPSSADAVAVRAVEALAAPVEIGATWAHVGASVGLALRHDGSTVHSLMREADVAMYSAKAKGKNRVERFDSRLDDQSVNRRALMADLETLDHDELTIDYQPVADLSNGSIVGLEALVRWQHPTLGRLLPGEFIGLAETTGAIVGIGQWVLKSAATQLSVWQQRHDRPDLSMSVNVSMVQLEKAGFADQVAALVQSLQLDPSRLLLEVTESVLAEADGDAAATLAAVRRLGVRIALDDFGTGYSSLDYLRRLPVDVLKIDRAFVSGTEVDDSANALLEAIVAMAHHIGLSVIAEGIEEPGQLIRLRAMGCRLGQGYLLSLPTSVDRVESMLNTPTPFPALRRYLAAVEPELVAAGSS